MTEQSPKRVGAFGLVLVVIIAIGVVVLGLLAVSITERRWEAERPALVLRPIADWEPDNAVWGENYPREYESYLRTKETDTKTKFGGSFPRDYLEDDPNIVVLFAGYGFSKEYLQARGHYYAVDDIIKTKRIKSPYNAGTCWTCKSTDVPRVMNEMGVKEFYAANWHDLKKEITHPIGCQDCHDPKTMNLRITRPALREAWASMGKNIDQATHQEMRSLVCAQCHVEYYFAKDPKNYLTFPWSEGTDVEDMIAYYDEREFTDWIHAISKTPMIKAQHPDYEMWKTGVHAFKGISCADCHMPYKSEGGVKYTDHHIQSPLLNIANSCNVCHRWSEDEIRTRVESMQSKVFANRLRAEKVIVAAHFDIATAMELGASDDELNKARQLVRHAQFRWDYVAANNGMGFHSAQESTRILADAIADGGEARLAVARLLASKGKVLPESGPDVSTRAKAWDMASRFKQGNPPVLFEKDQPESGDQTP
ncbi:MAG: ammonia-forming cytochrome c nitrite reductase subunit c552 [Proteobacteria bacterium]|nr:ammonia-forming cytochrome c nitrite reductase subunit c552 [Pseudomonadota bacterium]